MDYSESKIVLVDDQEDHLKLLCRSFFQEGIPCIPILYEEFAPLPSLKNIRLLFLDIKLTQAGSDVQMFTVLADYLGRIISPDNGPYALIFWTDRREIIPQLKGHIQERNGQIPSPFLIDSIDKNEIIGNESVLIDRLTAILSTNSIRLLFDLKSAATHSCDDVLDSLYKKIKSPNLPWGETGDFDQDLNKTFSKIAGTHYGLKPAQKQPQKAILSALAPLIEHRFINYHSAIDYSELLTELLTHQKIETISYPLHFSQYNLNSTFHVDFIEIEERYHLDVKKRRGCVISYNSKRRSQNTYCKNILGITYKELFESCFPYQSIKGVEKAITREIYESTRKDSQLVFIEISAACDYAQDKKRINPYIIGIMTKLPSKEVLNSPTSKAIMELPIFLLNNIPYKINVYCNYVVGLLPSSSILKEPLFILKSNLVTQIANFYANHISRIGISEFK